MKPYPAYKDSGIAWIGEVPEHWIDKRLKYSLMLITDKDVDDSTTKIALENIESWTGKYLETSTEFAGDGVAFKRDDLLFGKLRPYLAKVWQAEFDGNAVGDIFVYRANKAIVPRFAFYRFISRDFIDIVNGSTFGAKMPRASSEFIGNLTFAYPPPAEQTAIAAYLDRKTAQIDTLIERKRRLIQLLQEERTALISQAVTKGLNLTAKMKDSGVEWIGEVPEGWELKRLKYLLASNKNALKAGPFGSQLKGTELDRNGKYKVYNQRTVLDNDFTSGTDFINDEKYASLKDFTVFSNDILLTTRGTIGKCVIVPDGIETGVLHPCLIRVQLNNAIVLNEWLELYINQSGLFGENVQYNSNATTIEVIYTYTLKEVVIPVPPLSEQTAIAAYLDEKTTQIDQTIVRTERQIELLQEYRTALISAAVTGKIDVREEVVL